MVPGEGIPDLEYRLGQPGVEVGDDLSPTERRVEDRLLLYKTNPEQLISVDDVKTLVRLKSEIVEKMALLDNDPERLDIKTRRCDF